MKKENRIAIVGFGGAGYCAAAEARRRDPRARIDVYSDTDTAPCNPMLTTYYVKGDIPFQTLFPFGSLEEIAGRLELRVFSDTPVTGVEAAGRAVLLADGTRREYDNILLSTGASAFVPRLPGIDLPGVFKMRTARDAAALKERLEGGAIRSALVIGASWVGIKVVEDMVARGIACTLVDGARWIFPVAAFEQTAQRIHADLREKGVELSFGEMLSHIERESDGRLTAVMQNGHRFTADTAAVCIGIRPNTAFLRDSGLAVARGVLVDGHMRTNVPGVYAAGDCCEAPELQSGQPRNIGVWLNARRQGATAGNNMTGGDMECGANVLINLAHYLDFDFVSIGDVGSCKADDRVYEYEDARRYIRAVRDEGAVKCINMIGTAEHNGVFKNLFIKALENPEAPIDPRAASVLLRSGFPREFLAFLGWTV